MNDKQLRLECLKLVWPQNNAGADTAFYAAKAQQLFEYVMGTRPAPTQAELEKAKLAEAQRIVSLPYTGPAIKKADKPY